MSTSALRAQTPTNGTITTRDDFFWSTAPWVLSGSGQYPGGGGTATFAEQIGDFPDVLVDGATITLDLSIVLSSLIFNSSSPYTVAAGTGGSLSLTSTGPNTLNVIRSNVGTPSILSSGHQISAAIGGGGSFGLTKSGAGIMTLSGTNTYTGGTKILGGTLSITAPAFIASTDAALGATGTGNDVLINGGTLRVSDYNLITTRNFTLGAAGGTFEILAPTTEIHGVIDGSGSLTKGGIGGLLALYGANTYTGLTKVEGGSFAVRGTNGTIALSAGYDFAGAVTLGDATANHNDRISDTASITSRGASIRLVGNSSAATTEIAGTLHLVSGMSFATVIANPAQAASLQFAGIDRENNSTLLLRGAKLGDATGPGVGQISSLAAPGTLIGGGGGAGSSTISLLPWAIANTSNNANVFTNSSFVTYEAASGRLRPLGATEFLTTLTGSTSTSNVRLTGPTTAPASSTANALLFAPASSATISGGQINLTSGALLYSPSAAASGTIAAALSFGSAEGLITATNPVTLSGPIYGSGGLTINSLGTSVINSISTPTTIALTGSNTYTGTTTVNAGLLQYSGTVSNNGTASAFGASTSAIIMNTGNFATGIQATGASTFNRDLSVLGRGTGLARFGATGEFAVTMNGTIDLQRSLNLEGGTSAATALTLNGKISGPGSLTNSSSNHIILNGDNTYSGGTDIAPPNASTLAATFPVYTAGSDTAFGSGPIYFSGAGTIQGSGTTARVFANPLVFGATPSFGGSARLTFTGPIDLNGARSVDVKGTAQTEFAGPVSGGGLIKSGSGVLILSNPTGNTYSGGTVIGTAGGTILISNTSGSATGSGAFHTNGGVTLAGTGFINAGSNKIQIAILSPGAAAAAGNPGTIHLASSAGVGALTLSNASTLLFDLGTASDWSA